MRVLNGHLKRWIGWVCILSAVFLSLARSQAAVDSHVVGSHSAVELPEAPASDEADAGDGHGGGSHEQGREAHDPAAALQRQFEPGINPWRSKLRIASIAMEAGDLDTAEKAWFDVAQRANEAETVEQALYGLSKIYKERNEPIKLAYLLENFARRFPRNKNLPMVFMTLAETYYGLGDIERARKKYYGVLNAAVFLSGENLEEYRDLSRRAQQGIANSYFILDEYREALVFYERILRVGRKDEVNAEVNASVVGCYFRLGEYRSAIQRAKTWIEQEGETSVKPETYNLLAESYRRVGEPQEALETTMQMLRLSVSEENVKSAEWAKWREQTGNQIANAFFEKGDFRSALKIYQSLAEMGNSPEWVLPIAYQIGLCFENLDAHTRAVEAYRYVMQNRSKLHGEDGESLGMRFVFESAARRMNNLVEMGALLERTEPYEDIPEFVFSDASVATVESVE